MMPELCCWLSGYSATFCVYMLLFCSCVQSLFTQSLHFRLKSSRPACFKRKMLGDKMLRQNIFQSGRCRPCRSLWGFVMMEEKRIASPAETLNSLEASTDVSPLKLLFQSGKTQTPGDRKDEDQRLTDWNSISWSLTVVQSSSLNC